MTKLDWSKGYTPDPARVQCIDDFSRPKSAAPKTKRKSVVPNLWAQAMQALRRSEPAKAPTIDQRTLLLALGVTKAALKSNQRGAILRDLRRAGILLSSGKPNPDHAKVRAIAARQSTQRSKKKS